MPSEDSLIEHWNPIPRLSEILPDGSVVIYDPDTGTVMSLNPAAYAAYQCLSSPLSPGELRQALSRKLGTMVPEEVAEQAVTELEAAGLVRRAGAPAAAVEESRRSVLQAFAKASGYAIPAVLALKASEQRAFAQNSGSGTTTTTTTTTTSTTSTTSTTPIPNLNG
jgi:hypothetical protein